MLAPVRTVAPAATPVSLDEAKAHLHVDHNDDDMLITALIDAAVSHLDGYTGILGRAMMPQTWRVDYAEFADRLDIPVGPLASVTSVQYYDAANVLQTLAGTVYGAYEDALGPFIELKSDQSWPQTYARADAVRITWVAGYGAAAAVPAAIKAGMLLMIGHWYENREAVSESSMTEVPMAANTLLSPFRRVGI